MDIDVGAIGSGLPSRLVVDPDQLLRLKQGLEDERDRVANWLRANRKRLHQISPPGADPCSEDTVYLMAQNGMSATSAGETYVERLSTVIEKLHESAVTYGLVEDDTAARFRRGPA